jgi:murein DD-endopeptidase MepM/ murein hydrolase activator NlpD
LSPYFLLFKLSKKILISVLCAAIFIALLFLLDSYTTLFTKPADYAQVIDSTRSETEIKHPVVLYGMVINNLSVVEDHIKRNQGFFDLFEMVHVQPKIFQQLNSLSKKTFDFRKVGAHKKYTLIHENDSLKTARALVYEPNAIDYVIFHLKDSLQVEICQREVVTLEKSISGRIESSLSETIEALNISHELTNKFVDIFGWQVDFQRLQKGDQFKLIYEENLVEGKSIGIERVLAIYFEHFGKGEYAFPFDQGEGLDYFDEEGNSLRKALLKYPIEFTRISSRYNLNRFHPVAKVFRAHLGTDFAAPTGTPIRSVGDGNVEEARYTANNGNYVKIRHNSTYTTGYLHMSRIAAGVVAGTRVKQGQTIGYVGSTGLATGPHLCYRFWRNGIQIDALRVELPPSQPVKKDQVERFTEVKETFSKRLQLIPFPQPASSAVIVAGN